jgi:4-amino-4-deoxy-L-arabinose transferase-like glycosyltransferase
METDVLPPIDLARSQREGAGLSTPLLLAIWVLSGILLGLGLGRIPLERTQEARVLEVAREMIHQNFDGWMIPHANGVERLHKPPLAYWLSALSYEIFGVSLAAGRLPTVIAGWLTLGVVFWMVKWLFNRRAAFFAALALFASFLFAKFFRLAETDPLSTLFTTAATFLLWRGVESSDSGEECGNVIHENMKHEAAKRAVSRFMFSRFTFPEFLWYHAAAVMLGLALLAKGPQVVFPLLFFVCYVAVRRRWRCLGRLIISGAPITFAVVGLPWWIYVYITRGAARWKSEIEIAAEGEGHSGWFYVYIPYIFYGVAPWCAFVVGGMVESFRRVKRDWRHQGMLIWIGTIIIPLCCIGNKQFHYLIPLMVPLLVLAGWLIGEVWVRTDDKGFLLAMRRLLLATILGCLLVPIAVVIAPKVNVHMIRPLDWVVATVVLLLGLAALATWYFGTLRRAFNVFAACAFICMVLLSGWWMPTMDDGSWHRTEAFLQQEAGNRPVVFYCQASTGNLRFSYVLRRVVPVMDNPSDLQGWMQKKPDTVVFILKMRHSTGLEAPDFLREMRVLKTREETVGAFEAKDNIFETGG